MISTYLPAVPGLVAYLTLKRRMNGWGTGGDGSEPAPAAVEGAPARVT